MQFCSQCKNVYAAEIQFCPMHGTPLQPQHEFVPGMILRQKYEILEEIGSGGMGRVFRVKDLDFGYGRNQSAMKIPLTQLAADPNFVKRFRDEAAKARALNHANVVRIEHIDRTESGVPFLVMELVEGKSLRYWMRRTPIMNWAGAAAIAREIALALNAAHTAGLVHCDIKPENVLSVSKEAPLPLKVTDFGLAKATDALLKKIERTRRGTSWGEGVVAGTPEYMSPEQATGREMVGPPSDVYSLGVMFFEMLSGKTPFGKIENAEGARRAHTQRQPESLRGYAGLPVTVIDLVEEMIDRFPDRRPSAAGAVNRLDRLLKTATAVNEAPGRSYAEPPLKTVVEQDQPKKPKPQTSAPEHNNRGMALLNKGDLDGAIAEFQTALRLQPRLAVAHSNLGLALYKNGMNEAALNSLREAVKYDPNLAVAHNNLGLALRKAGNRKAAIASYRQALRIQPGLAGAHANLGVALFEIGDHVSARAGLREALRMKLSPDMALIATKTLRMSKLWAFTRGVLEPLCAITFFGAAIARHFIAIDVFALELFAGVFFTFAELADTEIRLRNEDIWPRKLLLIGKKLVPFVCVGGLYLFKVL